MQWLQDKKNLPFVIGGVVVLVIAAVVFIFMMMKGDSSTESTSDSTVSTPITNPAPATPSGPGTPGNTMPTSPVATTPGTPTTPGSVAGQPNTGTQMASADPLPVEAWRADPFAPETVVSKIKVKQRTIPDFPMPMRLFPPKPKTPKPLEDILSNPQPPRRVAGILYGERVNALIQTPNGFEAVRPGQTLSDGTLVERIERDRVFLRPAGSSKLIELKLAASVAPLESGTGGSGVSNSPFPVRNPTLPGPTRRSSSSYGDGTPM